MKRVDWENVKVDYSMINKIPQWFLKEYEFLPIVQGNNGNAIVISEEHTIEFKRELCKYYNLTPEIYYATKDELRFNLDYVSKEMDIRAIEDKKVIEHKNTRKINYPVKELYELFLKRAIDLRASDVHFEPFHNGTTVRYRVHGKLVQVKHIDNSTYRFLGTAMKILANIDIANKLIPHDGKASILHNNKNYDLRVSSMPVLCGEKIVIRILNSSNIKLNLSNLGFDYESLQIIRKIINREEGLVLVGGPTGSGKTTTLYSIINEINFLEKNVVTIEDPVEYKIEGINQVNLNPKAGLTFAMALRNVLRQDPDVILIGEIRDDETAQIAIKAAITGHLVLSTIHTNDTISTINRLENMGIPKHLIVDAITGIISQRLVSKACTCKTHKSLNEKEGLVSHEKTESKKCDKCTNGYVGRTLIYEIMETNQRIKSEIMDSKFLSKDDLKKRLNKVTFEENINKKLKNKEIDFKTYKKIEFLG